MRIETVKITNYKTLKDVEITNIGAFAVFLGENGTGKSTLFDVFGFLGDCLTGDVSTALGKRGGFHEVRSRESEGDIQFLFQYRLEDDTVKTSRLCTYELAIGLDADGDPVVSKESLRYRRGQHGEPWKFLDYSRGIGEAITNESTNLKNIKDAIREPKPLAAANILAINSLGQMKEFPAAAEFRNVIKDWFVSDFQINAARQVQDVATHEQLNTIGDNIANVARYLHDKHPDRYNALLKKIRQRIPGMESVEAEPTIDGRILLRFSDGRFKDPFIARYVSDGTIKIFAYLVMLADPNPHKLLCVEEPENQLYPHLLKILVEEFREYAETGGQVFVSTHSPDLVNELEPSEVYLIRKGRDGFSEVSAVVDNKLAVDLCKAGDKLGYLWKENILTAAGGSDA
ncbi:MAG: AAA family ATPase [Clostridiales Family XIII bacterium]|jgi:predicted ATPase|nr:AAA family ATPase [Clostridiales Family XIII bacterium]